MRGLLSSLNIGLERKLSINIVGDYNTRNYRDEKGNL
jgi:hypothetical protein